MSLGGESGPEGARSRVRDWLDRLTTRRLPAAVAAIALYRRWKLCLDENARSAGDIMDISCRARRSPSPMPAD